MLFSIDISKTIKFKIEFISFLSSCEISYLVQDQHWAFSDIRTGQLITKVTDGGNDGGGAALTSAQFHPDGLILGTGTSDATIKIWDLKEVSYHWNSSKYCCNC